MPLPNTTRLLLVRHGQTLANVLRQMDSLPPGPGLTDIGRAQAEALAVSLDGTAIDQLHCSNLVRTQETAAPLAARRRMPLTIHEGLREIEAADLEKRSDPESVGTYMSVVMGWAVGKVDARMPGGMAGHEFFARFDAAIADIERATSGLAVVFSHGASLRVWAASRCANLSGTDAADRELHNTGNILVERTGDGPWQMLEWNIGWTGAPDPVGDPVPE